jgi:hypothetical protein
MHCVHGLSLVTTGMHTGQYTPHKQLMREGVMSAFSLQCKNIPYPWRGTEMDRHRLRFNRVFG